MAKLTGHFPDYGKLLLEKLCFFTLRNTLLSCSISLSWHCCSSDFPVDNLLTLYSFICLSDTEFSSTSSLAVFRLNESHSAHARHHSDSASWKGREWSIILQTAMRSAWFVPLFAGLKSVYLPWFSRSQHNLASRLSLRCQWMFVCFQCGPQFTGVMESIGELFVANRPPYKTTRITVIDKHQDMHFPFNNIH